jgi:hypothetical protein
VKIRDVRPVQQEPTPQGFNTVARFTLVPIDGVVIYDCTIVTAPDGRTLVYGPAAKRGEQILSMAPEVRREIIAMTLREVGIDNDRFTRAA